MAEFQDLSFSGNCRGQSYCGGTGKTPHVEYLLRHINSLSQTGVVSRGYGRKSEGVIVAGSDASAAQIGDEPFQYFNKFHEVKIAVGSKRVEAIDALRNASPGVNKIILDDAFQHRYVNAGLYILLTDYSRLYTSDMVLPAGYLREFKSGAKRAHIIIVTKCPENMGEGDMERIRLKLKPQPGQEVYFSTYVYAPLKPVTGNEIPGSQTNIVLVTGYCQGKAVISAYRSTV